MLIVTLMLEELSCLHSLFLFLWSFSLPLCILLQLPNNLPPPPSFSGVIQHSEERGAVVGEGRGEGGAAGGGRGAGRGGGGSPGRESDISILWAGPPPG